MNITAGKPRGALITKMGDMYMYNGHLSAEEVIIAIGRYLMDTHQSILKWDFAHTYADESPTTTEEPVTLVAMITVELPLLENMVN